MDDTKKVLRLKSQLQTSAIGVDGLRLGMVIGTGADGCLLVDFEGNEQGSVPARLTSTAAEKLRRNPTGREVLLGFVNEGSSPIIIDTLISPQTDTADLSDGQEIEATVDRKRIVLNAEEEVVLRCGEASITLTSSGQVTIKGKYLLSRSSGTNSIKGSSVRIN